MPAIKRTVGKPAKPATPIVPIERVRPAAPAPAKPVDAKSAAQPVVSKPVASERAPAKAAVVKPAVGKLTAGKRVANTSDARPAASVNTTAVGIPESDVVPKQGSADVRVAVSVAPKPMVTQAPEGRSAQRAEAPKAVPPVQKDAAAAPAPAGPTIDRAPRVATTKPPAPPVSKPESLTATVASAAPAGIGSPAAASVDQAREAFASMRSSADTLTGSLGTSRDAAAKGMQDFATTLIDAMHTQLAATLDYLKALATVRTLSEAIELQSSHARQQFETVTDHAKALAKIATRTATDAAAPVGNVLDGTRKRSS